MSAEDEMSDALAEGCILIIVALLVFAGVVATVVKVWL